MREDLAYDNIMKKGTGRKRCLMVIFAILMIFIAIWPQFVLAEKVVKNIAAEGSCAIVGMSAEQCQLIALQRARVSAIEQAAGVKVTSSTVVTNMALTVDFIKTYAKGFIVKEKVEWLPLDQYQKDKSTPPIPEYKVRIVAVVSIPEPKIKPIGIKAKTNSLIYKNGEHAVIEVKTRRPAKVGIFNITADDKVTMLFPNEYEKENIVSGDKPLIFPTKISKVELIMHTLPDHKRDVEAFFVVVMDSSYVRDFTNIYTPLTQMSFAQFFQTYSGIADYCEDYILAYEVLGPE